MVRLLNNTCDADTLSDTDSDGFGVCRDCGDSLDDPGECDNGLCRDCDREGHYHQRLRYVAMRGGDGIYVGCDDCFFGDELEEIDGELYCEVCADPIEYECDECGEMFEDHLMDAEWTMCLDCRLRAEVRQHRLKMKQFLIAQRQRAKANKTIPKIKPAAEPAEPRRSGRLRGETVAEPPWIGLRGAAARAVEPAWLDL